MHLTTERNPVVRGTVVFVKFSLVVSITLRRQATALSFPVWEEKVLVHDPLIATPVSQMVKQFEA